MRGVHCVLCVLLTRPTLHVFLSFIPVLYSSPLFRSFIPLFYSSLLFLRYFLIFIAVFLILIQNVFLAIVLLAWQREKELYEMKKGEGKMTLTDILKASADNMKRHGGHKKGEQGGCTLLCSNPKLAVSYILAEFMRRRKAMNLVEVLDRLQVKKPIKHL